MNEEDGKLIGRKALQIIPGIGPSLAGDLWLLGVRTVQDLRGRDPEELYQRLCALAGRPIDRCVLYAFRCAVYYAGDPPHEAELLKWWNWSDTKTTKRERRDC